MYSKSVLRKTIIVKRFCLVLIKIILEEVMYNGRKNYEPF